MLAKASKLSGEVVVGGGSLRRAALRDKGPGFPYMTGIMHLHEPGYPPVAQERLNLILQLHPGEYISGWRGQGRSV